MLNSDVYSHNGDGHANSVGGTHGSNNFQHNNLKNQF